MQRKRAFTLVEMLVVIVIVAILLFALLPRFRWYLAKTRDLRRQTDLRNIKLAIEMYKNDHWTIPRLDLNNGEMRAILDYSKFLSEYISPIPNEPLSKHQMKIYPCFYSKTSWCDGRLATDGPNTFGKWVYLYKTTHNNEKYYNVAMLIAKTETEEKSNYVFGARPNGTVFWRWWWINGTLRADENISTFLLCNTLERVSPWEEQGPPNCKYSSESQLYYVLKIE